MTYCLLGALRETPDGGKQPVLAQAFENEVVNSKCQDSATRRLVSATDVTYHDALHVVEADPVVVEALPTAPFMALVQYFPLA